MSSANGSLDDVDRRILDLLARDGRVTLQQIADRVGLRRPSVHARVRRLEKDGIIRGYRAIVDPDAVDAGLVAFVHLTLDCGDGCDCASSSSQVADALKAVPEVLEYHVVAGADDAIVKLRARDVRDLERLVTKVVSGTAGVSCVRTTIVMSTAFERGVHVRVPPAAKGKRGA